MLVFGIFFKDAMFAGAACPAVGLTIGAYTLAQGVRANVVCCFSTQFVLGRLQFVRCILLDCVPRGIALLLLRAGLILTSDVAFAVAGPFCRRHVTRLVRVRSERCGAGCCSGGHSVSSMHRCHLLHSVCCGSVCSVGVGPLPLHLDWGVLTQQPQAGGTDCFEGATTVSGAPPGISDVSSSGGEAH